MIERKKIRVKKPSVLSCSETIENRLAKQADKERMNREKLERKEERLRLREERERIKAEKQYKKQTLNGFIAPCTPNISENDRSSANSTPQKQRKKTRRIIFSDSDDQ